MERESQSIPQLEQQSEQQSSDTPSDTSKATIIVNEESIPISGSSNGVTPVIHNISPRILSGVLSQMNQNAIDWSCNGLLAFACHNRVVIAEMRQSPRICQSLHRHHSVITNIKWSPGNGLKLASADSNGTIIIWDVAEASVLSLIPGDKETKTIITMEWIEMCVSAKNGTSSTYLIVNYGSNHLVLYDSEFGDVIWRKHFQNVNLRKFSLDPFAKSNVLFSIESNNDCSFGLINDLSAVKSPSDNIQIYQLNLRGTAPNSPKSPIGHLKYALKLIGSDDDSIDGDNSAFILNDYLQVSYHRSVRDQIFVVFNREIVVIDLSIEVIICSISLERSCSNLIRVYSCVHRNGFYALHDGGSITFRLYQKQLITEENRDTNIMQIHYATLCHSESLRLIKQNKVYGFCVSPLDETKVSLLLSNGRMVVKSIKKINCNTKKENGKSVISQLPFLSDLISHEEYHSGGAKKGKNYRLIMTQLMPSVSSAPHVIRMCPPVTLRNWPLHKPLQAIGDSSGTIQIWNLASALLEKELNIHSSPVRGIEWTGLETFLSFAYPNLSHHCGKVNNELNITQINSGRTFALRAERNAESSPIEMLKVSHLKQYFIIAFKDDPFEIWDLKSLSLLRVMPKKFTAVTAIEWSPLYNKRMEEKEDREKADSSNTSYSPPLNSKENFVATNTNGELYHFSIEGNIVKEISCIPPDTAMGGNITYIAWKSDQVLLGDADGNMNVWDLKKKISKSEPTHRGWIKKIRFGPGRGNMKILILYNDGVDLWDIKEMKLTAQLKSPRDISFKIQDIDWGGSDRPILASSDGTILITDLKLKHFTSSISDLMDVEINDNENINLNSINFHILPSMSQFIYKSKLLLNQLDDGPQLPEYAIDRYIFVSKLFGDAKSVQFWNMFKCVINDVKYDINYDLCLENEMFKELQIEKGALLESNRNNKKHNKRCCEWNLLLGHKQRAVHLLLETDQHSSNEYYTDALKACLVASLQSNSDDLLTTAHPVVKLVATNLIANGKVHEGTQLLCLIGKTQDACRYLQSANKWNDAVWLAKCTLKGDEYNEVMRRWCDHLISHNEITFAILVLLSLKQFTKLIQLLYKYDIEKAILLTDFCIRNNLIHTKDNSVIITDVINKYSSMFEDAGLELAYDYYRQLLTFDQ